MLEPRSRFLVSVSLSMSLSVSLSVSLQVSLSLMPLADSKSLADSGRG